MTLTIPNLGEGGASNDQAAPDSRDFEAIVAGFARSGVLSGCAVAQRAAGANMSVDVAAGLVAVAGTPAAVAGGNLAVGAADPTNPRFDLVVVNAAGAASVVAGTPAASTPTNSPHFPSIPAASVVLAAVYVPALAASVTTALITDKRVVVTGLGLAGRGAWTASTQYAANDLVTNNGGVYLAPISFVSGLTFNVANWIVLVSPTGTYASSLTRTAVKTADYAAVAGDLVPVDTTAGNITVTLPAAPADRSRLAVKHILQGGTNTVTVACGGADVFNRTGGATTLSLSLLAQGVLLEYTASAGVWTIVADDIALAQLDLRFARLASANEFTSSQTFDSGFTMGTPSGVSANVWLQSASQGWQGGPKWEFGIDTSNNGGGVDFYLAKAAWRVILDGVLNSTTTLTSATAAFGTSDVGKTVTGTGIPAATTIASVTDASTVVLSAAATATATGVTVTIGTVNAVGDLIYITNGKGGSPTVGIGVTPPGSSHRLQVAGSAADPALGGLRLIGVVGQTGDFLTVADSGNTTLLQVDKSGILRGSPTGLGGVGMALTVGAQVKALQMANSGITAVYGWEFNANTGTTIKFRYETGGKDLLTFDTAGNAVLGPTGLATNSTNGFVHIPYMAGAPTGTPTGFSGHMPITIDTTNSKIWVWTGAAWKGVVVA